MAERKPPHLIIGCGYTGLALARRMVESGDTAVGTSRSELRRQEIENAGAAFVAFDLSEEGKWPGGPFSSVTVLTPPPENADVIAPRIVRVVEQAEGAPVTVVVSTAIFGTLGGTVTERTNPAPRTDLQRRWALQDAAALFCRLYEHDVAVVRVPAIYGPGRDHRAGLLTGSARVIRPAPAVSRIHVEDLASLLFRMTRKGRPPVLLACDELPAPTWRVVGEAARLLDLPAPRELTAEEAVESGELGFEDEGPHSCRSIVRPWLGVR